MDWIYVDTEHSMTFVPKDDLHCPGNDEEDEVSR